MSEPPSPIVVSGGASPTTETYAADAGGAHVDGASPPSAASVPRRFIYDRSDMECFRHSSAKRELLSFVSAAGRGLLENFNDDDGGEKNGDKNEADADASGDLSDPSRLRRRSPIREYDPSSPLITGRLTPSLASLHGSLTRMSETWMESSKGGIPPDAAARARFGNPAFRAWHSRLVGRSEAIVTCLMDCHAEHGGGRGEEGESSPDFNDHGFSKEVLEECARRGYRSAAGSADGGGADDANSESEGDETAGGRARSGGRDRDRTDKERSIVAELRAYLHDSFGHPVRIDYGTGHESSFVVLLLSMCKIGCFDPIGRTGKKSGPGDKGGRNRMIGAASVSLFHAYLRVSRGLQRDYMLEPAGSHGVWGLDDYHCVPFYLGACQLAGREGRWKRQPRSSQSRAQQLDEGWGPDAIHDKSLLDEQGDSQLYFGCVKFVREIKPKVPFFESSPMLNDVSRLGNWTKVSSGLLRLYEGEVLDKMPVVQHFVFGNVFAADWVPSRNSPKEPPTRPYGNGGPPRGGVGVVDCVRPPPACPGGMPPTRAPWAK